MAKKKTEEAATPETESTAASAAPAGEKLSKKEAVQAALKAGKTKPIDGVNWIKEKYGISVTTGMFSSYKSSGGSASKSGKVKVTAHSAGVNGQEGHGIVANGEADPAKLAAAVKQLVKSYGVKAVKDMAGVFGE